MRLEEVIHLYLGCEFHISAFEEIPNFIGKLNKVDIGDGITIVIENPKTRDETHESSFELYDDDLENVKPILRKLEDMSEEDALELAKIYSGYPNPEPFKGTISNFHYFICFKETHLQILVISSSGDAWYTHHFDKTLLSGNNIVGQFEATRYLLSRQFDLFNLIENGLAIDKKTL